MSGSLELKTKLKPQLSSTLKFPTVQYHGVFFCCICKLFSAKSVFSGNYNYGAIIVRYPRILSRLVLNVGLWNSDNVGNVKDNVAGPIKIWFFLFAGFEMGYQFSIKVD